MKKTYLVILFVALLAVGQACAKHTKKHKLKYPQRVTLQEQATHMISYIDPEKGKEVVACTGTAIGPRTLLTASHCDEGQYETIRLDYAVTQKHILAHASDGRDHTIYIVDGPVFQNYVAAKEIKVLPEVGSRVIMFGTGGQDFPPHVYYGHVIDGKDHSDEDASAGIVYFDIPAIGGDSGSIVYDKDGNVVAIMSMSDEDKESIGFALAFPQKMLDELYNFTGDSEK